MMTLATVAVVAIVFLIWAIARVRAWWISRRQRQHGEIQEDPLYLAALEKQMREDHTDRVENKYEVVF